MQLKRVHLLITGQVQGVGYRFTTQDRAQQLGLNGWVRNRRNGGVEAVFEGESAAVEQMIAWCHEGPPAAVVEQVQVTDEAVAGLTQFVIERTL